MSVVDLVWLGAGFLLVVLLALGVSTLRQRWQPVHQRLDELGRSLVASVPETARVPLHRQVLERLDDRLLSTRPGQRLQQRLARAAVPLSTGQFLFLCGLAVALGGSLGWLVRRDLLSALILVVAGVVLPNLWVRRRERRRALQFTAQLPDTLRVLTGALKAGYSTSQALEAVGELAPEPSRSEFVRVVQEMRLGYTLPEAMTHLARRMGSDEVRLVAAAIKLSFDVGGNLASILDTTAHVVRERARLAREVDVLNAQQILTGNILMVLPVLVGGVLYLLNPGYMRPLFDPGPTLCIPVGAGALLVIGFVLVRRILAIEV
jgi:tight adherence protein B